MFSQRFAWCTLLAVLACMSIAAGDDKIRVLIVDGQNNHNWKAMTPPMKADLERTGRFTVDVATTPDQKAPAAEWDAFRPDFSKYDVVLSNYNGQSWPADVNKSLEQFVEKGGGLVIIHAANNAFSDWKAWNEMIGLGWRGPDFGDRVTVNDKGETERTAKGQGPGAGHGAQHEFVIITRDREHPVTKGMPAEWKHARDELYHGQRGPAANMHILATAYSDPKTGGTGANEPMIWWIPYGKGRVFTTVMGHVGGPDDPSIRCTGFLTVMERGCEWAATGKVTLPIKSDFPTAEEVRVVPSQPKS
ncbi:MAG TPA: ThuA domain-containing protein [Planctomycetaceae bacterium]|nr:ThuA domain-containing protein [Planctomycetaceae bacterium]